jgi:hypothetical protein
MIQVTETANNHHLLRNFSMVDYARRTLSRVMLLIREALGEPTRLREELLRVQSRIGAETPGNPAVAGYKIYSQCDEDGIIASLFGTLGDGSRTFVEIGCSDGLENNTHALLLKGWRGGWVDADSKKISSIARAIPANDRLVLRQTFVTQANASALLTDLMATLSAKTLDFLSVDIDGNDLGVLLALVRSPFPARVICVEYNAKFPPPMCVAVDPARAGHWTGDDYQGASLSAICDELDRFGYRLVCCNASGCNAFLVRNDDAGAFPAQTIERLYQPARYHLRRLSSSHPPSLKFLADALARER